ncbi:MAG: hypothetical protein WAP35_11000 [Solirubrobacterales bacterium]
MLVGRIAWSITTAMFIVIAVTLFLSGYDGYGGVFLAVAAAAAVNLLPLGREPVER